ncbi:proton-coupled amino acid transporter-like protein pathetic isoform X2 [Bradysia coprophila]|uniref:proton-coupled amino acid transporter-like protein pathetic isoform X2 n=1 Tax=Bradysia coprophila TaxID=38358 RepID=UPI00187D8027|nr:proton-coupled amino acid transporter-like protein pathetic isoform X2 [Bradysia coprophila]
MENLPSSRTETTLPVKVTESDQNETYNPFEHRKISHPTTDFETLIHFVKGCVGSGILSMPLAFSNAGLWFGLVATFTVGFICTYCVHILVKCAHILCKRAQIPSLDYAGIAETAFLVGHKSLRKWSNISRTCVKLFLILYLIGTCCVYVVLVASSIKQVIEVISNIQLNIRLYILMLLFPLILSNLVRRLKYLVWYSFIANILMGIGLGITLYYILTDLPPTTTQYAIASVFDWPMFFGTVIFAIEGMGVVMSLENNMKNPTHFIGCPGVLNIGMAFVVTLYATFGFLGFLKYGAATEGSITLNLPVEDRLAQSVKLMIALSIFLTYSLQFYVPVDIFWENVRGYFKQHLNLAEYVVRIGH